MSAVLSGCTVCPTGYWSTAGNGNACVVPFGLTLWLSKSTTSVTWSARGLHCSVLLNNYLLIMGGQTSAGAGMYLLFTSSN